MNPPATGLAPPLPPPTLAAPPLTRAVAPAPVPPVAPLLPVARQRFAVVDVETSGLSVQRHRILQVAVVTVLGDGTVLDRWCTDVRAWRVGPVAVHGIRRRRAWRAPSFRHVAPELAAHLDGTIVVAHHARFDWAFLGRAFRRARLDAPASGQLCTLQLSRSLDPDRQLRHTLGDLCERYGVARGQAHDALADAEATARVLPHLLTAAAITEVTDLQPRLLHAPASEPRTARLPPPAPLEPQPQV